MGVKLFGGEKIKAGNIVVRQRGTLFRPGLNAAKGSDDTIFAKTEGLVSFRTKRTRRYDNSFRETVFVDILPAAKKTA